MSNQYIEKLESGLIEKGWKILQKEEEVDWAISGVWKIQRSSKISPFYLEFDGMDAIGSNKITPMVSSDGCYIRGNKNIYLRFKNYEKEWSKKLNLFLSELDRLEQDTSKNL